MQRAQALRCIVLTGAAGSGKTALLRSWARKARTAQITVVRIDAGAGRLSDVLATQCAALVPGLAAQLSVPLPSHEEDALTSLAIALVRHEALLPRPIVLVFDQLHLLREPAALQGLQPLLDYCPRRVQCIFASRAGLPLLLGRLREHGEVLELRGDDLRWTQDEAQSLVRVQLGDSWLDHVAQWLAETEGWSMGLTSICRALRAGAALEDRFDEAFRFLESEVLLALPSQQLALLTDLAATDGFDLRLGSLLSGMTEPECAAIVEDFAAASQFVCRAGDGVGWRFQATLGRLLRERFERQDAARRRQVHRCASACFAETGRQLPAVHHAVCAGDTRRAAELVEGWAGALFRDGDHDQLAALVRLIPVRAARRNPRLRLWSALLALLEHRYDDCRATLDALERGADAADAATQRRMRVVQGWLAVFRDDVEAAIALFPADERPDEGTAIDEITLAGERNVRSWIHIYRNDYQRARDLQAEARGHPSAAPYGTLFGVLSGRCLAGLSLALEGRMSSAERTYREVLEEARARGPSCIDPAVLAVGLLGETLYETNDLAGVLALEEHLPELRRRSLPDPFLRVMLCMLRAHSALGRIDEALRHQSVLEDLARERGLDRLLSYALLERIRLYLLQQDPEAAAIAWECLARLRRPHGPDEGTALGEVAMVADRAEILLSLYRGRIEQARSQVDRLLQVSVRRGRRRRVAALHFQRAAIDDELGDTASAHAHVLQGLALGQQLGLVRSLLDVHPSVPALLDGALRTSAVDAAMSFHADRLRAAAGLGPLTAGDLGAARRPPVSPASRDGSMLELSEREAQIFERLLLALPNKEIARELGLSPETVKWHLHNIYAKLGVPTRYAAIRLLREQARRTDT